MKPRTAAGVFHGDVFENAIEPDGKVDTMKQITRALAIASTVMLAAPEFAQADKPDIKAPSGQN